MGTSSSPDDICLLSGPLQRFLSFSRQEHSKWLIDIAHDICDPAAMRGSLSVWNEATRSWRPVAPTDPLIASTYMYSLPPGTIVGLTKISARSGKSATDATGNATMADCVKRRDTMCWVTGARGPLVSSHVCPKRMGDHLAWRVLHDFESAVPAPNLSIYDEIFGISLVRTLGTWFDNYLLGLRLMSPNIYECHAFGEEAGFIYTTAGEFSINAPAAPIVHGHRAGPPHPLRSNNPPPGLIRWHYLQCVVKHLAHEDYRNQANIWYPELPIQMEGDSDDEGTDSELGWPSAPLDFARDALATATEEEQRDAFVVNWIMT